jgi:hypothetical protein
VEHSEPGCLLGQVRHHLDAGGAGADQRHPGAGEGPRGPGASSRSGITGRRRSPGLSCSTNGPYRQEFDKHSPTLGMIEAWNTAHNMMKRAGVAGAPMLTLLTGTALAIKDTTVQSRSPAPPPAPRPR